MTPFARSYLFVPANRPDRIPKAARSGAHRIIVDLEDAVGPAEKELARNCAGNWFAGGGVGLVRINGTDTAWFEADLAAVSAWREAEIMVPKACVAALSMVGGALPGRSLVALVESVEGLAELRRAVHLPGVTRLAFGNLDFGIDSGISGEGASLDPARFEIAIASRLGNLPPPIDGVTTEIGDAGRLEAAIRQARDVGFAAKLCIHPGQIEAVNAGFSPSRDEIAWAEEILRTVRDGDGGVVRHNGKMVDRPVIERARSILNGIAD